MITRSARTVEGPQVIQISGRKELPDSSDTAASQSRSRSEDSGSVRPSARQRRFQQPLQGRKLRVRLPIVRMQDHGQENSLSQKRSEQAGGHRSREGKLRLRSQLPQRRSDGKTPLRCPVAISGFPSVRIRTVFLSSMAAVLSW